MKCPECGEEADVPMVDIGVGEEQCAPASCPCGWFQDYPGCSPENILEEDDDIFDPNED